MRRLLCTCIALSTLACSPPDAGKAAPAKPTEAKPADPHANPHAAAPQGPVNPHAVDPHAAPAGPPKVRAPVNPQPISPSGKVQAETLAGLSFSTPTEWIKKPGSNSMRLAEYTLPGPGGEVTLVVSRFAGGGGDAAANVQRWKTQLAGPDGAPVTDAKVQTALRPPLTVTTVDISGTNVAPVTPGSPERYEEPNSRLLGAIVEGDGDPYFFKAVGPAPTLATWEPAFITFAASIAPATK